MLSSAADFNWKIGNVRATMLNELIAKCGTENERMLDYAALTELSRRWLSWPGTRHCDALANMGKGGQWARGDGNR